MIRSFFILAILFFAISFASFSQKRSLKKANEAFSIGEYHTAYAIYEKAFEKLTSKPEKAKVAFKLGECSRIMMNERKAAKWYKKATRYEIQQPIAWLYLANSLKMLEKYDDANEQYKKYKNLVPNDSRGRNGIKSCELINDWKSNPTRFVVSIAEDINSKYSDFCPSYGKSKSEIYFSSNRESANGKTLSNITGNSYSDIFVVTKDRKGKWSTPTPIKGNVNSNGSEGAAVIINEGAVMYFSVCKQTEGANIGCKIYRAKNNASGWSDPEEVVLIGDSTVSVGHPAISNDELIMYFVSDSIPGAKGHGGKDIWFVKREKISAPWGKPINAGSKINTKGDEKFPYFRENGELYFSSDGHYGMGGLDIFKAKKNGTIWEVENMKFPINSSKDDFGITFYEDKNTGYLSSKRNKKINIYSFKMPDLFFSMKGLIINSNTNAPLAGANVKLTSPSGHEIEIKSASDGTFRFNLNPNTDYSVIASKSKFLSAIVDRSTKGLNKSKEFDIILDLASIQTTFELPNIEYDLGKATLRPESMVSLDKLIKILTVNSHITIELASNTDFRGSDASNQDLSERRAQSVIDYLIKKGIKEDRLTPVGNGEKKPKQISSKTKIGRKILSTYKFIKIGSILTEEYINALETDEQKGICHQLNRRTEFRVLRDDYGINAVKFGE